ncbi:hypothetical protein [Jeotgalibacillus haloalkalitolerans]|uniref:Bacteriophage protein n=1 Tax=Jeotgalibacillus haloalkalitolerans TaxID=3104292 RepID=A0ABU5KKK4_9BACL|nr:hypothetical protein [Jeotgalibacillus sp. HH7-29]MDZ5711659.1 hypothetical protein [Jeotgalibacillus sp. HH7-29]
MARRAQVSVGNRLLERALRQYGDDIIDEVKKIVVETTEIIYNQVISLMQEDDGNLKQSTTFEISADGLSGKVEITAHYAVKRMPPSLVTMNV